jgi:hypothetical protein
MKNNGFSIWRFFFALVACFFLPISTKSNSGGEGAYQAFPNNL